MNKPAGISSWGNSSRLAAAVLSISPVIALFLVASVAHSAGGSTSFYVTPSNNLDGSATTYTTGEPLMVVDINSCDRMPQQWDPAFCTGYALVGVRVTTQFYAPSGALIGTQSQDSNPYSSTVYMNFAPFSPSQVGTYVAQSVHSALYNDVGLLCYSYDWNTGTGQCELLYWGWDIFEVNGYGTTGYAYVSSL